MKLYPYVNTLAFISAIVFLSFFLTSSIPLWSKVVLIVIFSLVLLLLSIYRDGKKMMLKAGHAEFCAKKIGRLVAFHAGTYSPYAIMKIEKGKGK